MRNFILLAAAAALLVSCGSTSTMTMGEQYAAMYEEKPVAIAVMPPINLTTHAEAKDYFYTTLYQPLCEKGYYVFSPYLTMEMFQQESAYDAEQFLEADLSTFANVLGADAVMFTKIKDWRRNNVGGKLSVNIEYILRSTKTGQTLYNREGDIVVDTSVSSGGGGLLGTLINVVATTVATAATDKVVAGRKCNAYILSDLPAGKYSPNYQIDAKNKAGKKFVSDTVK